MSEMKKSSCCNAPLAFEQIQGMLVTRDVDGKTRYSCECTKCGRRGYVFGSVYRTRASTYNVRRRTRSTRTIATWNRADNAHTGRRRVTSFDPWTTVGIYDDAALAEKAFEAARKAFIGDVAVFHAGKRLDTAQLRRRANEARAASKAPP